MPLDHPFVLTRACRDTQGILHAVAGLLCQAGCNISDSPQFGEHRVLTNGFPCVVFR